MAAAIFSIDFFLPQGMAGGMLYVLLVLFGWLSRDKFLTVMGGFTGTVLAIAGLIFSPPGADFEVAAGNCLLVISLLWLITNFCFFEIYFSENYPSSRRYKKAYSLARMENGFLDLIRNIAIVTNMNQSSQDALSYSLKQICEAKKWPLGHIYLLNPESNSLVPSKIWYSSNPKKFFKFTKLTENTYLSRGTGLPGRVLESGKRQWIKEIGSNANFPRAALASEAGIRSGYAFPIFVSQKPVGVMEFFSEKAYEPLNNLLEVMQIIGVLLGRVIERGQMEKERISFNGHLRPL